MMPAATAPQPVVHLLDIGRSDGIAVFFWKIVGIFLENFCKKELQMFSKKNSEKFQKIPKKKQIMAYRDA